MEVEGGTATNGKAEWSKTEFLQQFACRENRQVMTEALDSVVRRYGGTPGPDVGKEWGEP